MMCFSKTIKILGIVTVIEVAIFLLFITFNSAGANHGYTFLFAVLQTIIVFLFVSMIIRALSNKESRGFSRKEIAMLYSENKSIIEQINEAIISIDIDYNITTVNKKSDELFGLTDEVVGKNVYDVFPHVDFKTILNERKHRNNRLIEINGETLLISYFPLYSGNTVIGATTIFRSRLEVEMLLDQISGYQKISKALREQKHEFQNKLHVILGLIKMKDTETAENYIMQNVYTTNLTSDHYSSRLLDDKISALFVGKEIQSKEFDVQILLSSDSTLTKKHRPINSDDLIIIIGNLIDNSLEAYGRKDMDNKKIEVSIIETDNEINLQVIDNAGGVDPSIVDTMFNRGVSTKGSAGRGTGLSLVREIVKLYNGTRNVESTKEETKIEIVLSKVKI